MTDKLREALENIRSLVEETWGFASASPRGKENLTEVLNLLDLLCAPSAGPPAPIAGVTAIYCGWGCSCVTQCGDTYDYAGQPKPPLRPAAPAQPPAALETCQNCGDLPYPGCSSEFQGEPSCRFWPAAAPSVEAEPAPGQAAAGEMPPLLPHPGSPEASAMIDSVLAEYGWPSNTKNAARAGYVAAQRLLATQPTATTIDLSSVDATAERRDVSPQPVAVRRLVDAAMAVISRHDEWVRQMPAGALDDPLSVSLAALHDAAETVGISLDIVRRYAAPLQQPQEGWVSVDERLPEKFVEVLVAFADSSLPSTGQYTANPNDHDGWCYPKENCDWMDGRWPTVTHWMPLPDHPHEELFAPPAATNQNGAGDA